MPQDVVFEAVADAKSAQFAAVWIHPPDAVHPVRCRRTFDTDQTDRADARRPCNRLAVTERGVPRQFISLRVDKHGVSRAGSDLAIDEEKLLPIHCIYELARQHILAVVHGDPTADGAVGVVDIGVVPVVGYGDFKLSVTVEVDDLRVIQVVIL